MDREPLEGKYEGPSLSDRDKELVRLECERQNALSRERLAGLEEAFRTAKEFAFFNRPGLVKGEDILKLERSLAEMIEPEIGPDYRRHDLISFANGSKPEAAENLPRTMLEWAEAVAEAETPASELYRAYEENHPREDGNGRKGMCTWSVVTYWQTGEWPKSIPPDVFAEEGAPKQSESAFGPIERD